MMDRIPLARVSQFTQFTDTLDACGTSPERALRHLNLPMWHHCRPDGFFPLYDCYKLADLGGRTVGTDRLGILVMERSPFQTMGRVGDLIAEAPTVYQALRTAVRLLPAHGTSKRWWLAEGRDDVWFCRGGDVVFDVGEGPMIQYALAGIVQVVRLGAGPRWRPSKVKVQTADALGIRSAEMFSEADVRCDPTVSAVAIPRSVLCLPMRRGRTDGPTDGAQSDGPGDDPRLRPAAPDDFVGSLREVVATLLFQGSPRIETAAEIAGLTARTLQRRLERDGLTYTRLVEDARFKAARRALADPDASVSNIAFDLGYSDVAHFSRAFRRWAGVTPRAYRRLQMAG